MRFPYFDMNQMEEVQLKSRVPMMKCLSVRGSKWNTTLRAVEALLGLEYASSLKPVGFPNVDMDFDSL